jgi:hypothetical protein
MKSTVITLPGPAARTPRAGPRRRDPGERRRGRAWINGREIGGTDPRYAHLSLSHD